MLRLYVSRLVEARNLTGELPISMLAAAGFEVASGTRKHPVMTQEKRRQVAFFTRSEETTDRSAPKTIRPLVLRLRSTAGSRDFSQENSFELDAIRAKQIGR